MKKSGNSDRFKNEEMTITPVGYVRSKLKTPSLQAKEADLKLEKGLQQAAMEAKNIGSLVSELVITRRSDPPIMDKRSRTRGREPLMIITLFDWA